MNLPKIFWFPGAIKDPAQPLKSSDTITLFYQRQQAKPPKPDSTESRSPLLWSPVATCFTPLRAKLCFGDVWLHSKKLRWRPSVMLGGRPPVSYNSGWDFMNREVASHRSSTLRASSQTLEESVWFFTPGPPERFIKMQWSLAKTRFTFRGLTVSLTYFAHCFLQ